MAAVIVLPFVLRRSSSPHIAGLRLALTSWPAWLACACGQLPLEPAEPSEGAPHFLVMSYNIEFDAADEPTTLAAIGESGADVVGLQEVTPEAEAVLREMYAEVYPHQLYYPRGGAGGLGMLSKFPLTDAGLLLSLGGWHPAWHVLVEMPELRVQVLNVHLRSLFSGNGGPLRSLLGTQRDHLRQIEDFTRRSDDSLSNIVLGDFNENEDGDAVRYLEARGFTNILPQFRPGQPTWRFPSVGNQVETNIDHILYDETLRPLNAWVERKGESDHLPVLAHFEPWSW